MDSFKLCSELGATITENTTEGTGTNDNTVPSSNSESNTVPKKEDDIAKEEDNSTALENTDQKQGEKESENNDAASSSKNEVQKKGESITTNETQKNEDTENTKEDSIGAAITGNATKSNVAAGQNFNMFNTLGIDINTNANKKSKTKSAAKKSSLKPEKPKITGVELDVNKIRIVKVYGQEVLTIKKGEKEEIEEIRNYLVETLGFREFQKDETDFAIITDKDIQYIIPRIKFKPKG